MRHLSKLLYITLFALLSGAPPYLPLYFHDVIGFASNQVGLVMAISPFVQSLSCPLWAYLVDRRPQWHGVIMATTSLMGGLAVMAVMVLGNSVTARETLVHSGPMMDNPIVVATTALALMFAFFTMPNVSLVDSAVLKMLGPNKILYGEQRLWGSISTGCTVLLVGQLISHTGQLDVVFWVFGISTIAFAVCAFMVPTDECDKHDKMNSTASIKGTTSRSSQHPTETSSTTMLLAKGNEKNYLGTATKDPGDLQTSRAPVEEGSKHAVLSVLPVVDIPVTNMAQHNDPVSPQLLCFLCTALLLGIVISMITNFLFLFLSGDMQVPTSWIGWTGPLGGLAELVCFSYSKHLITKFGDGWLLAVAHFVIILRCFAYTSLVAHSTVTNLAALVLQTLNGIGFGLFWTTAVSVTDNLFPPKQRSLAQGMLGALHLGLGSGIGALVGGYLYEYYGPTRLFQSAAGLTFISLCIFCLGRME